ncbi:acyltransferase [Bradyrhizobium sp. I1.7.5]|uniref:acyltransferase family protein n=1 Tax=Bradyrhizobium sp. I1.7.5 TaxID=3156363 RepID=UPI00339382FA
MPVMGWIRFLLAALVVAHHCEFYRLKSTIGGHAAVEAFFFVSGFYMAAAYPRYVGRFAPLRFWVSRYLRLYPLYITLLFSTWLLWIAGSFSNTTEIFNAFSDPSAPWIANLSLLGQDVISISESSQLLMPVRQAWSISAELAFYALMPLIVRMTSKQLIAACVVSFAIKAYFAATGDFRIAYFPFFSQLGYFIGGVLLFRIRDPLTWRKQDALPLVALASIYLCLSGFASFERGVIPNAGMIFAISICMPTAFQHTKGAIQDFLGDISYGIYLIHFLAIEALVSLGTIKIGTASATSTIKATIFALIFSAIAAAIFEVAVQSRIDRWRRRSLYNSSVPFHENQSTQPLDLPSEISPASRN